MFKHRRQRQEQIGDPHQAGIDAAARHAGARADDDPDHDGNDHRGQADRHRNPPAIEHSRKEVLAEIVGAQRMAPRRTLQTRGEIDFIDRHLPDPGPEDDQQDPLAGVRHFATACGFEQRHSLHVAKVALQLCAVTSIIWTVNW